MIASVTTQTPRSKLSRRTSRFSDDATDVAMLNRVYGPKSRHFQHRYPPVAVLVSKFRAEIPLVTKRDAEITILKKKNERQTRRQPTTAFG
jgi:hypothetical protein